MQVHVIAVGYRAGLQVLFCKHMCLEISFAQLPLFSLKQEHSDADFSFFLGVVNITVPQLASSTR